MHGTSSSLRCVCGSACSACVCGSHVNLKYERDYWVKWSRPINSRTRARNKNPWGRGIIEKVTTGWCDAVWHDAVSLLRPQSCSFPITACPKVVCVCVLLYSLLMLYRDFSCNKTVNAFRKHSHKCWMKHQSLFLSPCVCSGSAVV